MFSEQDVDRELKAALSVSPSPDFEARVLQRVEADRPSRWPAHYGWLAAAASLAIAAGVFYALTRTSPAPAQPPQIVERTVPRAPAAQRDIPAQARASTPTSEAPRVAVVRADSHAPLRDEPEVIVSVNQMEAVRRLVRVVNEGRLPPPVEPAAEPSHGPMTPPTSVSIAPFVVKPIPLSQLSLRREGK